MEKIKDLTIVRACRCSFVVRTSDGLEAFIANQALFLLMEDPHLPYKIRVCCPPQGGTQNWVWVKDPDTGEYTAGIDYRNFNKR